MSQKKTTKQILLIAPLFFEYYKEIIKEAEILGYEVDYICDTASNSNLSKAIGRINKNLIKNSTQKYFNNKVLPNIQNKKYDCILLVAGMTFSFLPEMIEKIRELNTDAKFAMYQWDSEKNLPYSLSIHKLFDEIYSFDRSDCQSKSFYRFLPLFYTTMYEEISQKKQIEYKYDCSYVGTAHPKKYKNINDMSLSLKQIIPNQFIYHYMPSKLKYYYHKIKDFEFKKTKFRDFRTEKVPKEEMEWIFQNSRYILDSSQTGQTGLTIRTIECIGAKKKLITTNTDIRFYDFYREENILIYDGKVDEKSVFFTSEYLDLPKELYEKYSLRTWLKTIVG